MGWFQAGRAESSPAAFGFVSPRNPPTEAQQQRQRDGEASRRWALTVARRRLDEAREWQLAQIEREAAREREIKEQAREKAETIRRARAQAGPRWGEDPVDYACRIEAEDKIRRQRAAREPDSVDLVLARGGGPAPTRQRGGAGKSRAQLAAELRALLPPDFQQPRRTVRLRPAMGARYEVRG